jgi:radical SAM superfamily enzyme
MHHSGWTPLSRNTYVDWAVSFLERLPPGVIVQRVTGDPDPRTLYAPAWALEKQRTLSLIEETFQNKVTRQGSQFEGK